MKNYCHKCGTEAHPAATYCHRCGTKINDSDLGDIAPFKRNNTKLTITLLTIAVTIIIGSIIGWYTIQSYRAALQNKASTSHGEHTVGETFMLSNGKSFKVVSAQVTDKVDGERQLIIKVEYDNPNLDQLNISLYNNGEKITDQRYNQPGTLEYKGLDRNLARGGYSLLFDGGDSVKLSDIAYNEIPNNAPSGQGLSNGKEWEPFYSPTPQPIPNNASGYSPSNLQCNTYDYGYSTSTNCYTY